MTSFHPPLPVPDDDRLDAAASAVVDGCATPADAALVAASPQGLARVAALRAVAEAVGHPGAAQGPAAAADALAAALATFDSAVADGEVAPSTTIGPATNRASAPGLAPMGHDDGLVLPAQPPEPADPSTPAGADPGPSGPTERTRPGPSASGRPRRTDGAPLAPGTGQRPAPVSSTRWLGAVAAALVVLGGIGVLAVNLRGGGDTAALSSKEEAAPALATGSSERATSGAPAATAPPAGDTTTTLLSPPPSAGQDAAVGLAAAAPAMLIDGGAFGIATEVTTLAQRAGAALGSPPDPATARSGAALPTDVQRCVGAGPRTVAEPVGRAVYQTVGTFQGIAAVAVAYARPAAPPHLLLVLARADCALLASAAF